MRYRVKKGVVLFSMLGQNYLFPSRKAGIPIAFLVSISDELTSILKEKTDLIVMQDLDMELQKKINRLLKLGYIEEEK